MTEQPLPLLVPVWRLRAAAGVRPDPVQAGPLAEPAVDPKERASNNCVHVRPSTKEEPCSPGTGMEALRPSRRPGLCGHWKRGACCAHAPAWHLGKCSF